MPVPSTGRQYHIVLSEKHVQRLTRLKEQGDYDTYTEVFKAALKALEERMER